MSGELPTPGSIKLIDKATGNAPSLSRPGDAIIFVGHPERVGEEWRQLVELRPVQEGTLTSSGLPEGWRVLPNRLIAEYVEAAEDLAASAARVREERA